MRNASAINIGFKEFGVYVKPGYTLIKACEELNRDSFDSLMHEIEAVEAKNPQHYLIDVSALKQIGAQWGRLLVQTKLKLKRARKKRSIHIINGTPELVASLKEQGLDSTVTVSENVEEACRKLEIKPELSFDVRVVAPFINSFTQTLETMTGVKSQKRTAGTQKIGSKFLGDVVGINTVVSPSFNGIIAISFPKDTILALVGKITGAPFTEINSLVQSAVGEILNVTVTGAKKTLNESGYGVRVDLPKVSLDTNVPADALAGEKGSIVVTFDSNVGPYFIEIRFS